MPPLEDSEDDPFRVSYVRATNTVITFPDMSYCPEDSGAPRPRACPPLFQRAEDPHAAEPQIGAIIEEYEGQFNHYSLYAGNGEVVGLHSPAAAISMAKVEKRPISLWWRPVYAPKRQYRVAEVVMLVGETVPYVATSNNCYDFCVAALGLDDSWLCRKYVTHDTGYYPPKQTWNGNFVDLEQMSKLELVRDAALSAFAAVFSQPVKDLLNKFKPLNLLHILSSCDWTFSGIVEAVVLVAGLLGVLWSPPDVVAFLAPLMPSLQLQGPPTEVASEIIPLILGGIGMAIGLTSESIGRMISTAASTLRACKDIGAYGMEIIRMIAKYFFPNKTDEDASKVASGVEAAIIDMEVLAANNLTGLLKSKENMQAYMKVLDLEEEKVRKISSRTSSPDIVATTNALLGRISATRAVVSKAKAELSARTRPVVIMISGRPGIGKTYMAKSLAQALARANGQQDARVGIVPRNDVDHWDAYRGESVVLWDDYGMGNVIKDALRLQELADTCPVTLNCDRIENKGKMFGSEYIIVTTNLQTPAPLDYVNMEAVARRVDFLVYAESPDVEAAKTAAPGDPKAVQAVYKKDHSHLVLTLAPQGGFDRAGNTPHGKGVTKRTTFATLQARAIALAAERRDEYELQGAPLAEYDFNKDKVATFRQLAADNGYSLIDALRAGTDFAKVKSKEDLAKAARNWRIKRCVVMYGPHTCYLESDGKGTVLLDGAPVTPAQAARREVATALERLWVARARFYVRAVQQLVMTLIQTFASGFVISRAVGRIKDRWKGAELAPAPKSETKIRPVWCDWDMEAKGKTKTGRGRKHTAFSSKGLSDEEYDEYKKIREERGGKYSIQEYLEDRDRFLEEVTIGRATEENFTDADEAALRQRIFRPTRKQRAEERRSLGLVSGIEIRKRKPDDFNPKGPLWADDQRTEIDYKEEIRFEAPASVWARIVPFGSGWGFWVSPNLFITTTHVVPPGAAEFFGCPKERIQIHRTGEFVRMRFPTAVRPDVSGMVLDEGAPEGTVATILVKRTSGETMPLAVRMGTQATMKVQGRQVVGQVGMLLTGANAKGMDLGTLPGDCGCPYVYKRGNDWVVIGVHTAASRGGNTVIAAVQAGEGETTLEGPAAGTYCGAPIVGPGQAPTLSTKTKFWRSDPGPMPPETYIPAYLGGKDPRVANGPSLQQVLRDQLKPFTQPRGKSPKPHLLKAAKETVENFLEQTVEPARHWSYAEACQSLDKTTSSGHPYHVTKNEHWNGQSFTGPLADQASKANLMYEQGKHMTPLYTAALKDELVKPTKVYGEVKKRLLWGADLGTMIRCARAFGGFCESMKKSCNNIPVRVGININEDGPIIFEQHARYHYHMDADYTRWDSTQQRAVMAEALDIMVKFSAEPELATIVAQDLAAPSHLDVGDFVVSVAEGLPSGTPCTSQLNSIMHWLYTLCAMADVTGLDPDVIQANSVFSFYGDDEIISTDIDIDAGALTAKLKEYGLKPTRPDKTEGPLIKHTNLAGLTFLRRLIVNDNLGWYGRLEKSSIERQLYWTRGPNHDNPDESLIPHAQRATQLMCLLGEAALHGRKFYSKVASRVINEVKAGGMDFYVPKFEALFRWMRFSDLSTWEGDRNLAPDFVNEDGV
ncbi:nonstructural polyprotein [Bat norovirus]|uniref:Genome polyprotein n=1 Tax=Bat norovirus TaxID=1514709 RepID=A0A2S1TZU7_NORV|nr:nonstructural polyprotein [Bat norovirus]